MKLDKLDLIKVLIEERNLHFTHPSEVARKVIFSLGTVLTTFIATTILGDSKEDLKLHEIFSKPGFEHIVISVVVGYLFILWGLNEHTKIHAEQRKRLQNAIDYLMSVTDYDEDEFWQKFGKNRLRYYWNLKMKKPSQLFTSEPDTRNFWGFHDRKIEAGIILILIGFILLLRLIF